METRKKRFFIDLIKFWVAGTLSIMVAFTVLIFSVEVLHLNPTLSSAISFVFATVANYLLLFYWTFVFKGEHADALFKYLMVMSISMILNVSAFWLFTEQIGIWYIISQFIATCISSIFSFLMNRHYTFA